MFSTGISTELRIILIQQHTCLPKEGLQSLLPVSHLYLKDSLKKINTRALNSFFYELTPFLEVQIVSLLDKNHEKPDELAGKTSIPRERSNSTKDSYPVLSDVRCFMLWKPV